MKRFADHLMTFAAIVVMSAFWWLALWAFGVRFHFLNDIWQWAGS